jgi:hypothetical protein
MAGQPRRFEEFRVTQRLAATIGLLVGLAPAWAYAQTNIDQGKTPAQIFAADCAECHKATRALASGKNNATLTDFLREHYTTSRDQAAALAAYVLSARGGESGATPARGQKPTVAHAAAPAEEPKPAKHQARQPGKPDEGTPATVKLQPQRATTAARNRKEPNSPPLQEPASVAHEPAAVVAEPAASTEAPSRETNPIPAATAPADAAPGENALVPRDDIPD